MNCDYKEPDFPIGISHKVEASLQDVICMHLLPAAFNFSGRFYVRKQQDAPRLLSSSCLEVLLEALGTTPVS